MERKAAYKDQSAIIVVKHSHAFGFDPRLNAV